MKLSRTCHARFVFALFRFILCFTSYVYNVLVASNMPLVMYNCVRCW